MIHLFLVVLLFWQGSPRTAGTGPDNHAFEPFRIADNLYYVGSSDIASYLITTRHGHILIDAGYESTVPIIRHNVTSLGFRIEDVKILLNTQAHFDHVAGLAAMKKLTGASLMISDGDADLIERGGKGDFAWGDGGMFPPVHVDRRLKDGEVVRLDKMELTARLTPGHTRGCTTWTFLVSDRGQVQHVVIVGGASINPGVHLVTSPSYPGIAADYARTFAILKSLPCDFFLGAHGSYYGMADKAARLRGGSNAINPFVDREGFRTFIARSERTYLDQVRREKAGT